MSYSFGLYLQKYVYTLAVTYDRFCLDSGLLKPFKCRRISVGRRLVECVIERADATPPPHLDVLLRLGGSAALSSAHVGYQRNES